jgi:hypothetical protein
MINQTLTPTSPTLTIYTGLQNSGKSYCVSKLPNLFKGKLCEIDALFFEDIEKRSELTKSLQNYVEINGTQTKFSEDIKKIYLVHWRKYSAKMREDNKAQIKNLIDVGADIVYSSIGFQPDIILELCHYAKISKFSYKIIIVNIFADAMTMHHTAEKRNTDCLNWIVAPAAQISAPAREISENFESEIFTMTNIVDKTIRTVYDTGMIDKIIAVKNSFGKSPLQIECGSYADFFYQFEEWKNICLTK